MVCATVCLTVMQSSLDVTDVSTVARSFKIDNRRTPLFHVAQYGDDIIGRELHLDENCPVGRGSRIRNLLNCWDGTDAHDGRVYSGNRHRANLRQGFDP